MKPLAVVLRIWAMQSSVCHLVDAWPPSRSWMSLPDSEQEQLQTSIDDTAEKHRSPLTGRLRDVELHAARQSCAVASLRVTPPEPYGGHPVRLEELKHRLDGCLCGIARASEIVGKRPLIDMDLKGPVPKAAQPSTPRRQWAGGQSACRTPRAKGAWLLHAPGSPPQRSLSTATLARPRTGHRLGLPRSRKTPLHRR
jgi:hypothetical protein